MKYNTFETRSFIIACAISAFSIQTSTAAHHHLSRQPIKHKKIHTPAHPIKSKYNLSRSPLKHKKNSKPTLHFTLQSAKPSAPTVTPSESINLREPFSSSQLITPEQSHISQISVIEQNTDLNPQELQKYFSNLKVTMETHPDYLSIRLLGKAPQECLSLFSFQSIDPTTHQSKSCNSSAGWIISDPNHAGRNCIDHILEQTHTLCSTLHPCANLSDQNETHFDLSANQDIKIKHFQRNDARDKRDPNYLECSEYESSVIDPTQSSYKSPMTLQAEQDAIQALQDAQHRTQTLLQVASCRSSVQEIRTVAQPMLELAKTLEYMTQEEVQIQSETLKKLEKSLLIKEIESASPERLIEIRDELLEQDDSQDDSINTQKDTHQNLISIIQQLMKAEEFDLAQDTAVLAIKTQSSQSKDTKYKFLNYQIEIKIARALALIKTNSVESFVTPSQIQEIINQSQNNATNICRAAQFSSQKNHQKNNQIDKSTCTQSIALLQRASLLHQQAQKAVDERTKAEAATQSEIQQALMFGAPQNSHQLQNGYSFNTMPSFMNMPEPNSFTPPFMGSFTMGSPANMPMGMPMYL